MTRKWNANPENVMRVGVHFNLETEKELYEYLCNTGNKSQYIKRIVREDNTLDIKKTVNVEFYKIKDADLIEKLESVSSKSQYIKSLIKADMEKQKKEGGSEK